MPPGRRSRNYEQLDEEYDIEPEVERKQSVVLPNLEEREKLFFDLVASGDIRGAKEFLQENYGFNINCVNFQGLTVLHIAVHSQNESMVAFLLEQKSLDLTDTVLHAVRDNKPKILDMLLDRLKATSHELEYAGCMDSSDFPDHMTPLTLAAQCGHFEIIEQLLARGHPPIKAPHKPGCRCPICVLHDSDDLLYAATYRLNTYRAITNPAYMCHSSNDPIYTAFVLSKTLKECAFIEREFTAAYRALALEVSNFAVELIGCCRNTEEMELVLKQKQGARNVAFMFPRLIMAMDYKQKEFVAHPNTQQVLETAWIGDWYDWKLRPEVLRLLTVFPRALMLPIIFLMCLCVPSHDLVNRWSLPINKMINHTAGYLIFLLLVFLESNLSKEYQRKAPPNSGIEIVLIIFVVGYIWSTIRQCSMQGPRRYFTELWNWYEIIMLTLFSITFLFWLAALIEMESNIESIELERKYWHHLDPVLIAEGSFTIATIMAFFKLMFLCQLNYYLGPLQVSLGKMTADIFKYIFVYIIIISAFTAGLSRFYEYYDGMIQVDEQSGMKTQQVSSFVSFQNTLKTLFWALFCMSPLESADVVIENLPGESDNSTIINQHSFTEAIGYIAFACFEFVSVIVILNMLIATMSNTFQRVNDNVEVVWTFGRTEVYVDYMCQTTLPSPFNLFPTASGIASFFEWLRVTANPGKGKVARCTPASCCFVEIDDKEKLAKNFPHLMTQLVQRYFRDKECEVPAEHKTDTNTQVVIEELREEVSEIRAMLLQLLDISKFTSDSQ